MTFLITNANDSIRYIVNANGQQEKCIEYYCWFNHLAFNEFTGGKSKTIFKMPVKMALIGKAADH